MYDSYQEHADYENGCYQNEFQAAYAVSQQTTPTYKADEREIDRLIRNGFHVVIVEALRYCRFTDATLPGCNTYIDSAHPSRAAAERHAEEVMEWADGLRII